MHVYQGVGGLGTTLKQYKEKKGCWLYKLVGIEYSPNGGSLLWMGY